MTETLKAWHAPNPRKPDMPEILKAWHAWNFKCVTCLKLWKRDVLETQESLTCQKPWKHDMPETQESVTCQKLSKRDMPEILKAWHAWNLEGVTWLKPWKPDMPETLQAWHTRNFKSVTCLKLEPPSYTFCRTGGCEALYRCVPEFASPEASTIWIPFNCAKIQAPLKYTILKRFLITQKFKHTCLLCIYITNWEQRVVPCAVL